LTASADRPGDLLVRAHEARHVRQRIALLLRACDLLCARGVYTFALVQADAALSLDEKDLAARQRKGRLLARLNKFAAAREWVEDIVNGHPKDAASWSLLGEIEKAEWVSRWRRPGLDNSQMRERAAQETHLLVQAIEPFHAAISLDPMDFTAGANALTLRQLLSHLTGSDHHPVSVQHLCQAVRRAANAALKKNPAHDDALAALADAGVTELCVFEGRRRRMEPIG
jgi:tetratricopeptide (TPR) repeat protein